LAAIAGRLKCVFKSGFAGQARAAVWLRTITRSNRTQADLVFDIESEVQQMAEIGLFDAMYSARALRRLKPDPVPDELISKIIEAGTQAASGGSEQHSISRR
jgi:hypothetical protein